MKSGRAQEYLTEVSPGLETLCLKDKTGYSGETAYCAEKTSNNRKARLKLKSF
jgi:hypothetical protein